MVAHTPDGAPLEFGGSWSRPPGLAVSRYDKVNLVPFGEFVPVAARVRQEDLDARLAISPPGNTSSCPPSATHRLGTFICYESVFPNFVRQVRRSAARRCWSTSPTTAGSAKPPPVSSICRIVRMRAVENRRWILRSTNDGFTSHHRLRRPHPRYAPAVYVNRPHTPASAT